MLKREVLMEAASGHGKVVRIHVDASKEAEWRRRAFVEAKQRLDHTYVDDHVSSAPEEAAAAE